MDDVETYETDDGMPTVDFKRSDLKKGIIKLNGRPQVQSSESEESSEDESDDSAASESSGNWLKLCACSFIFL